ncbi:MULTISPECIES: hypothetical protein [unclassified Bosea (in: a-proteobacteria)]|uniref:hypothetical protein n=1 Tax=unclassified Bosea (in: a-proteobacteria) TaxID=2653178 RepID=UPI000F75687A|nr:MULTISPECIES: hypothetical protein [unclassified Bosea (in: a-proteobacteria)]AZO79649.1 hypothetical protein BLM15_20090 [Bosea sp. Tri-49]RXT16106.1 hypothetical protein B5U98_29305 [Bosea sp. Tri-39]RXT39798.1 hypothetical protein B5U99_06350 [Bosea sp. Tri-54]
MNRRTVLKSAAPSIAIAFPVTVAGCIPPVIAAAGSPDAALVDLGVKFDQAHAAWVLCWKEWQRIENKWQATFEAKGMSFAEHGAPAVNSIFTELGGDEASDANDAALALVQSIADQIRAMRATTIAGIAAKAKVACFDAVPMHEVVAPEKERDYGPQAVLALLAEIEAVARAGA